MKTFSVAVAVAVVLTFICVQQSSAVPVTENLQHNPQTPDLQQPQQKRHLMPRFCLWYGICMLYNSRHKRGIKCRFCCGCCTPGICGVCCRF
ncbi:hepcidin [Sarotherodon galilaeus]